MNEAPEDLHHRLHQLRLLAMETTDPLAERLVRDMIAELEDRLAADLSQPKRAAADDGAVAGLVGIECGVVSRVINLESSGVEASDWRPRHDEHYHEV